MLRLRRGTVALRFTLMYGAVFLASGAGLLALAFVLSGGSLSSSEPAPGQGTPAEADGAQQQIAHLQAQLAEVNADRSRQMLVGSLLALLVMALASLLIGRLLARRVLRPLRRITAATRDLTADDLHRRLAVQGPDDEVKDLADTIDGLLERLEAAFAAQRRFGAHASHELRTPLATMRAVLDVAAAKPGAPPPTLGLTERLRPQLDHLDRLLDGLLALARTEHGAFADPGPVDLAGLARAALAARAADIASKDLHVTADLPGAVVDGDRVLLGRMVANLVDNAVLHNEHDGHLRIAIDHGDRAVLTVANGGTVLEPSQVHRLTRPFQRLGADRTGSEHGSGLGLAIAAAIAAAHGGTLDLTADPAGGLRVRVALPLRDRALA